jgi:predicted GNAT family acetyltransferase
MDYCNEIGGLIERVEGYGGSLHFQNKGFICRKCCRFYFTSWKLKSHQDKCFIKENGFILVNKKSPNSMKQIAENMGHLSKLVQRIDFAMTSVHEINVSGKNVLLYFEEWNLKGMITFYEKSMMLLTGGKKMMTLDDIYVPSPYREKGIGSKLVQEMLGVTKTNPKDIVVNHPNRLCIDLIKKFGIENCYGNRKL